MNKTSFSPLARVLACRFRLARLDLAPTIEVLVRSSGFFAPLVSRARAAGWKAGAAGSPRLALAAFARVFARLLPRGD